MGKTVHGHSCGYRSSPTHSSWVAMKTRCFNKNSKDYQNYGKLGITVSPRWLGPEGFLNFLSDLGKRPAGTSLDRYPNKKGNYCPENCRWATASQQTRNQINRKLYRFARFEGTLADWAERLQIPLGTLSDRIARRGWPLKKAFTTPPKTYPRRSPILPRHL